MTNKKTRHIVPVHCPQSTSRPVLQEKELEDDIWKFSPIRIGRSSSPLSSEPRRSRYRTRELAQHNHTSHGKKNVPPPPASRSTQSRRRAHSGDDDSGRAAKKQRLTTGSEPNMDRSWSVGRESNDDTQPRLHPDSRYKTDEAANNQASSSCSKEFSEVGHIVDSINKMAAEAREDRQAVNDTLKKMLSELQRRL